LRRASLDPENQRIFDAMSRVRRAYFKTRNDDELLVRLRRIERGIEDEFEPGHALVVFGESGTGKTTVMRKALKSLTRLQDYDDGYGNMMRPILYITAPSSCTMPAPATGPEDQRCGVRYRYIEEHAAGQFVACPPRFRGTA